jgi:hypothetical protein
MHRRILGREALAASESANGVLIAARHQA